MPVMPVYTPGLGEALAGAFQNYAGAKRQRRFDDLEAQTYADRHQGAEDTHLTNEIGNAVNYNFLRPGQTPSTPPSVSMPAPRAAALPGQAPSSGGDDFASALASTFAGGPVGSSDNATPADGGRAQPMPTNARNAMGQQLVQAMAKRGSSSAQAQPTAPNADFQSNLAASMGAGGQPSTPGLPSYPHERITLSNGASIDPLAGFQREAYKAALMAGIKTDADVDTALRTGVIDKNTAEALKNRREASRPQLGDAGYADAMGGVAAAEAAGKEPSERRLIGARATAEQGNTLAAIRARAQVEVQLQKNQQDFESGKLTREQKFAADQQARTNAAATARQATELQGTFLNRTGEQNYTAGTSLLGRVFGAPPAPTVAPSTAVAPVGGAPTPALPPLTAEQTTRATAEPTYKQFLISQGYKLDGATP